MDDLEIFKQVCTRIEDYFKGMVHSKNDTIRHAFSKEFQPVYTRHLTKRVSELPSLRYGSVGAKSISTGPLRVNNYNTIPKRSSKKIRDYSNTTKSDQVPVRPPRRVRFTLPATDGDGVQLDDVPPADGVVGPPAAGESCLRTCQTLSRKPNTRRSQSTDRLKSSSVVPHCLQKLSEGVSVPVTASPGIRNRTHPTGRYIKGTLSPTANATPQAAASPEEQAFLRAARDGDDHTLKDLLRRAALVGIADSDLNAIDSSGRTLSRKPNTRRSQSTDRLKSSSVVPHCLQKLSEGVSVPVTASPGIRNRTHPTGRYIKGTLSPTANATPQAAASPEEQAFLRAARDGDDLTLKDLLRRAALVGIADSDLNAIDSSGRTILSYIASNGSIDLLEQIVKFPGLDPNKPDNEGNTPLHFVAQAGQAECLNCMLSRCRGIEVDAKNNLGFTPLMKAAIQGRNKCAKLLLFAGANPTLRDNGRGFRADQWARFCGRYVCADVIEKHARQRLLERSTSYGNWGGDNELAARILMGKVVPLPPVPPQPSHGLKSKLRRVFRTSSGPSSSNDAYSSARLVTQLTSAALCASSPVLPSASSVPPVVKSLIRPLTVPRLQITLVATNGEVAASIPNGILKSSTTTPDRELKTAPIEKPARAKKKK